MCIIIGLKDDPKTRQIDVKEENEDAYDNEGSDDGSDSDSAHDDEEEDAPPTWQAYVFGISIAIYLSNASSDMAPERKQPVLLLAPKNPPNPSKETMKWQVTGINPCSS